MRDMKMTWTLLGMSCCYIIFVFPIYLLNTLVPRNFPEVLVPPHPLTLMVGRCPGQPVLLHPLLVPVFAQLRAVRGQERAVQEGLHEIPQQLPALPLLQVTPWTLQPCLLPRSPPPQRTIFLINTGLGEVGGTVK